MNIIKFPWFVAIMAVAGMTLFFFGVVQNNMVHAMLGGGISAGLAAGFAEGCKWMEQILKEKDDKLP